MQFHESDNEYCPHLDEGEVLVRPDLGEVEGVLLVLLSLLEGHHLDVPAFQK